MENKEKIILDLCGGTGAWSMPYTNAGYDVRLITLPKYDVTNYIVPKNVYGILASPPCQMFSLARTKAKQPRDLEEGMKCVRACLNIIWYCMEIQQETNIKTLPLKFWALENPNGMLKYFLGKPAFQFDPYEFGDGYKKRTYLWGWFNEPKKNIGKIEIEGAYHSLNPEKMKKFDLLASREIHPEIFEKLSRQERRSITPACFAKAFYNANK